MESSLIKRLFIYMTNEKVLQNYNYIPDVEEKHSLEAEVTSHSHHKTQESWQKDVSDRYLRNVQELNCP